MRWHRADPLRKEAVTAMEISRAQLLHLAALARLDVPEAEADAYAHHLTSILDHVATLDELDLSDVPPTTHPFTLAMPLRADQARQRLGQADALQNAPDRVAGHFRVPRVI